jgi:hypothetical protein
MPRLLRTVARTAVIAGTATTVSNRVSRRQAGRWADKDQQQQDQSPPDDQQQQQYAAPPPAPPADPMQDKLDQLKQLGELKEQGVLSDEEFQQQKAKILNS